MHFLLAQPCNHTRPQVNFYKRCLGASGNGVLCAGHANAGHAKSTMESSSVGVAIDVLEHMEWNIMRSIALAEVEVVLTGVVQIGKVRVGNPTGSVTEKSDLAQQPDHVQDRDLREDLNVTDRSDW